MPTIAELLDRGTADRLAAARRQAEQRQDEIKAEPVQAACCDKCGQRLPVAPAVFRAPRS